MKTAPEEHGDLMDIVYRRQRYFYDITRKYYLFGRDRLVRELCLQPGERLVEVGCGTARNLIAIARLYPHSRLFGIDASEVMLDTARNAVRRAGLEERISIARGYAEELTPGTLGEALPFDRAVFSYSLSMIPDWKSALHAAATAVRTQGRVHLVDFGDLGRLGKFPAWVLKAWLRQFHVTPRTELLHALEGPGATARNAAETLWISPGRYSYLWSGPAETFRMWP
ncbi:MAG TPA: methyltransferase domain-containing protein [Rhizomicrobium sp.]